MRRRVIAVVWCMLAAVLSVPASAARDQDQDPSQRERISAANAIATRELSRWLGPAPFTEAVAPAIDVAWREDPSLMRVESQIMFHVARQWLARVPNEPFPYADSIAWYLQSRLVGRAFDERYLQPAYSYGGVCFFNCQVQWRLPLLMNRWQWGMARSGYVRATSARAWPLFPPPVTQVSAAVIRGALAIAMLERDAGWPALQGSLNVLASAGDGREPLHVIGDALGRDLSALAALLKSGGDPDYAVESLTTVACQPSPCYRTTVLVSRDGDVVAPMPLRVTFVDRREIDANWDGRETQFVFESAAPALRVSLDPEHHVLIDRNFTNNTRAASTSAGTSTKRWLIYWSEWLQDAMLAYTFPI